VRFIVASMIENFKTILKYYESQNWSRHKDFIYHYVNVSSEGKDATEMYGIEQIPHTIVVDKNGIIRSSINQNWRNPLDIEIFNLLEKPLLEFNRKTELSVREEVQLNKFLDFCLQFETKKLSKANYQTGFSYKLKNKVKFNSEGNELTSCRLLELDVVGELRTKEFEFWTQGLKRIFPDLENEDISPLVKESTTFDIETNEHCNKCLRKFSEEDGEYYCHWCKISFCQNCTEELLPMKGFEKYVHIEHNLLYFRHGTPEEKLKNLDTFKLGKNLFTKTQDEVFLKETHNAICNGCSGSFKNTQRYLCISCKPGAYNGDGYVDFCFSCVEIFRTKDILKEAINFTCKEHDHDNHVYLRLIHEVRGYREY
jgi:hypothetical protein